MHSSVIFFDNTMTNFMNRGGGRRGGIARRCILPMYGLSMGMVCYNMPILSSYPVYKNIRLTSIMILYKTGFLLKPTIYFSYYKLKIFFYQMHGCSTSVLLRFFQFSSCIALQGWRY